MRYGFLSLLAIGLAGCPGSGGEIGDVCGGHGDCDGNLQCSSGVCVPRCARAPECGDGYSCSNDGICTLATGQPGDACTSEVDCSPGLACHIDGDATDASSYLLSSCTAQQDGKPAGSICEEDLDCRNGTCALGHCVDLCTATRDCAASYSCMEVPRIEANGSLFRGCLPASGNIIWPIRVSAPTANTILFPVPSAARYAQLVFSVDDLAQRVGASTLTSPSGVHLYTSPCETPGPTCDPVADFYNNTVRHTPELGQSVMAFPSTPNAPLETGAYRVQVSSYRKNKAPGTAIPRLTALVRIDTATLLDLRFHFLDLDAHVCQTELGGTKLDSTQAQTAPFFQEDFVGKLREIFSRGGIALGNLTYDDILDRPDLDELDVLDSGALLSLGTGSTGIDVFFVRALSPSGLQAFGPSPGPAGIPGTRQSGIVIGLDTLCYRSWTQLARLTAYELARYMGLSHNVELDINSDTGMPWGDNITDSDTSSSNLMFFSELGGTVISPGQRDILSRSGVLR